MAAGADPWLGAIAPYLFPGAVCSPVGPARGWGLLGDPHEQNRGRRAARTHPRVPPPPRLGSSSGEETDRGEKPARKGCGLAGGAAGWGAGPPPRLSPPGTPSSEPSGFLSPGRCPADAQPTEAETAVWNQVNAVLEEAQAVLAELQSYTGAGQEIREVGAALAPVAHPPTVARGDRWCSRPDRPSKTPGTCGCRRGLGAPSAPSSPS